ncbi:DUF905 family protein [Enterobacter quasiroggenkampii]|uniref:DUF905 family protein n=1 Tax=Enterobacter quasiroggenkampii TaxID=2497436 RepID=UPI002003EF0C|nr:DUF905 family protein [Enterobacter quasiroggenkampii]
MSKILKEFLDQPAVQHMPTTEEVELAAILNVQPEGGVAREQADVAAAGYEYVAIKDGRGKDFRLGVRRDREIFWRA